MDIIKGMLYNDKVLFDLIGFYALIIGGIYLIYLSSKGDIMFTIYGIALIALAFILKLLVFPFFMKKAFPLTSKKEIILKQKGDTHE